MDGYDEEKGYIWYECGCYFHGISPLTKGFISYFLFTPFYYM